MAAPDMDVIKEVPGYRVILKAVLKSQIQQLVSIFVIVIFNVNYIFLGKIQLCTGTKIKW